MRVIDPSTGEPGANFDPLDGDAIEEALRRAQSAFGEWRRTPLDARGALLRRLADSLREGAETLAERMSHEMGKPLREGRTEALKCAWVCEHYAEHGPTYLRSEPVQTDASESYVAYRPLGVVLAIMPWNFPLWQVFRHAAPALMAGDAVLLKHAENVPGCAEDIAALFEVAGAPPGLFTNLRIEVEDVAAVIEDSRVRAVTLTGSTRAGRDVAARAGRALTPTVLELGGSDAYLILEDADLERAADACVTSRLLNAGQSCIAAKRFIVVDSRHDEFLERVIERMRAKRVGDPRDPDTDIGPLARADLRETLHRQVLVSVERGATLALGGEIPAGAGFFYPPTVLSSVKEGMPAFDEELFGPVAAIVRARDEEEAIRLANATAYGLGAGVFTRDVARGKKIAETQLEAGSCFVNAFVRSDPRLPFGGICDSGYGRELARAGILELVNAKTVYVA